ncbi:MAG: hypothetical protein GY744_11000 [Gammaproteobacteria bacterium]|nr:hypothetical protein [Gammaproteobacteria bacterium]
MPFHKWNFIKNVVLTFSLYGFCNLTFSADLQSSKSATQNAQTQRPKIGLVLSGGGARGFAHIGVLKILEQNNVPIDYIVGTSMGSIVAGLYAMGLTPEEIEKGVQGIEWGKVFDDFAYRDYKSFRRKQDDYDFFSIYRVGITDDGMNISPGLIEGQQVELALDRLAYPGFHINDFDKFRIPYRAIATDIATGEAHIIKSGNLARAMRASMSIPGALPPVTINGKLLVDGGIGNNVPIDVVREMGADTVIVVDVSAPLSSKEELNSAIDITGQLTTILTRRIADIQISSMMGNDVLVVPGEKEISSSDFDKYPELIKSGEVAATEQLENIRKLSLSEEGYSSYITLLPTVANKKPVIEYIDIKNETGLKDDVMRVRLRQKIGTRLDVPQLEQDLSYIYGLDYSGSVVYSLEQRDGKTGLVVYVRDRKWAHSYLQFGLNINDTLNAFSQTNLNVSYNYNNLNDLAGEFRAVGSVGTEPKLTAELYQPVNIKLDTFLSLKTGYISEVAPILIDEHVESVQQINRKVLTLSAGQLFLQNTNLSLGIGYNDGHFNSAVGLKAKQPDFVESYYYLKVFHDSLDNLSFPNTGFLSSLTYTANRESIGADMDYDQLKLAVSGATTFGRYTVFGRALFETTSNDEDIPLNAFLIHGGLFELSGTVRNELLSPHFGLLEVALYRRLGNISFLPIYTGFSLETGNAWGSKDDINTDNLRFAGSIFIGADTFMGPLYFSIGATDRGEQAIYLNIGKTFLNN